MVGRSKQLPRPCDDESDAPEPPVQCLVPINSMHAVIGDQESPSLFIGDKQQQQ
jgi:hypothetical protein